MAPSFEPNRCDLCGSVQARVLLDVRTGRAMRSDQGVVAESLRKVSCLVCGLVRTGNPLRPGGLEDYYAEHYTVGLQPEHYFYGSSGPRARSTIFRDWLVSVVGPSRWGEVKRAVEVGAGAGRLMAELARTLPAARFVGLEPHRQAAAEARARGLAVYDSWDDAGAGFDLAYSIAVVEHVASPTAFLREIGSRLRPGGQLVLSQPTQDVRSYDIFFADHLHHFATPHLRSYARKCGFAEETIEVGHPLMPNFSMHVWRRVEGEGRAGDGWSGPPAETTCGGTAARVLDDMARLDALLTRLQHEGRRTAVFGLREVYWLARCYSGLGEFPFVCGLDDEPDRPEYAHLGFPVRKPEACLDLGVRDVVLAMNAIYHAAASERLARLGLLAHPILS